MEYTEVDIRLKAVSPFADILASINKNIILQDLEAYVRVINNSSEIILSGFLKENISLILEESEQFGLELVVLRNKNKWQMLHLKRA